MDAPRLQRLWDISDSLAVETYALGSESGSLPADVHDDQVPRLPADAQDGEWTLKTDLGYLEETILKHEAVENAAVVCKKHDDAHQDDEAVAFVTLKSRSADDTMMPECEDETDRVQFWDDYWNDRTYTAMDDLEPGAIGRDFLGWTSMYDGKEIDKGDMNEWLDETIATIKRVHGAPRNVLELGAGSGMILFNLARESDVRSYVGLEMSPTAVAFVQKAAASLPDLARKIHMLQGTAADLDALALALPASPDLVVLNSVAQYFPSQDYLVDVITSVARLPHVETLFLGDMRSYALYDEFLLSKALHEAGATRPDDLQTRIAAMKERELELLVDPAFFTALADAMPERIHRVEIHPKRMEATNELSCFRYAAVLYFTHPDRGAQGETVRDMEPSEWIDFGTKGWDRAQLLRHLENSHGAVVAVSNIPNSKTIVQTQLLDALRNDRPARAGSSPDPAEWRLATDQTDAPQRPSLTTLELLELGHRAGYRVELSAARQYSQRGGLDAVFHRCEPSSEEVQARVVFRMPTDHDGREPRTLCTHPLELAGNQAMREQLGEFLQSELPVHLLPQEIRIVEALPMKENGEVDRQTLARLV